MTFKDTKPIQGGLYVPADFPVPMLLKLAPVVDLTDEMLLELSSLNRDLRFERNAQGDLEVMPPNYPIAGCRNAYVIGMLGSWTDANGTGIGFDSSVGIRLPNGAVRSPDASWLPKSRLINLTEEEKDGFLPFCPDFVVELRSEFETLGVVQAKMQEYIENGSLLGWLIDPVDPQNRVYIYRPGMPVEVLEGPESLSGEPELPGFTLDLKPIWEPAF